MLQAIETRYAGCRFRSRLEARWAVFFDVMGIPWEYEAQGFEVFWRLDNSDERFSYLPDFWFPTMNLWGEVKGSLHPEATLKLLNAAACLSSNNGGGCHDAGGQDLLVLGPIPEPTHSDNQRFPIRLHMHKGDLNALVWPVENRCYGIYGTVANDSNGLVGGNTLDGVRQLLLDGRPHPENWNWSKSGHYAKWLQAFKRARSARFEHGESG